MQVSAANPSRKVLCNAGQLLTWVPLAPPFVPSVLASLVLLFASQHISPRFSLEIRQLIRSALSASTCRDVHLIEIYIEIRGSGKKAVRPLCEDNFSRSALPFACYPG